MLARNSLCFLIFSFLHLHWVVVGLAVPDPMPLGPFTDDFTQWLQTHHLYRHFNFSRPELGFTGSYGGRSHATEQIYKRPIVFFHGNSDGALAIPGLYSSGWSNTINYLRQHGYSSAELYATTWGDRDPESAHLHDHSCKFLIYMRMFVEAVLEYTGSQKIDIISHSMGVTLARKVVKGGIHGDGNGLFCNISTPLTRRVVTFIGLAGANYGMCNCEGNSSTIFPTCNSINGFWPGDYCGENYLTCGLNPQPKPCKGSNTYSSFLTHLNHDATPEGQFIFSVWSTGDDILQNGGNVYSIPTPMIPNSQSYTLEGLTHMQTKDLTTHQQYNLVTCQTFTECPIMSQTV